MARSPRSLSRDLSVEPLWASVFCWTAGRSGLRMRVLQPAALGTRKCQVFTEGRGTTNRNQGDTFNCARAPVVIESFWLTNPAQCVRTVMVAFINAAY